MPEPRARSARLHFQRERSARIRLPKKKHHHGANEFRARTFGEDWTELLPCLSNLVVLGEMPADERQRALRLLNALDEVAVYFRKNNDGPISALKALRTSYGPTRPTTKRLLKKIIEALGYDDENPNIQTAVAVAEQEAAKMPAPGEIEKLVMPWDEAEFTRALDVDMASADILLIVVPLLRAFENPHRFMNVEAPRRRPGLFISPAEVSDREQRIAQLRSKGKSLDAWEMAELATAELLHEQRRPAAILADAFHLYGALALMHEGNAATFAALQPLEKWRLTRILEKHEQLPRIGSEPGKPKTRRLTKGRIAEIEDSWRRHIALKRDTPEARELFVTEQGEATLQRAIARGDKLDARAKVAYRRAEETLMRRVLGLPPKKT